jgi:hypothetical protein
MIKISSLKKPRRDGKAEFTYHDEELNQVVTKEIPISFLKPTETLWNELALMESQEATADEQVQKGIFVKQLARVEIQSTEITEDDGRPHNITEDDLLSLDLIQLAQLWEGVKKHFFLRTQAPASETTTNSTSEPEAI